jgi:hypothetical protein
MVDGLKNIGWVMRRADSPVSEKSSFPQSDAGSGIFALFNSSKVLLNPLS